MYDVLDICRYVINYSDDKDYIISNLKLQKVLYFIQARFLIEGENSEPCFHETIEAWDFGPVIPKAYHEYKRYGASSIPRITSFFKSSDREVDDDIIVLSEKVPYDYEGSIIKDDDKKLINEIVDLLSNYSATDLVNLTHNQKPWKDAYEKNKNNEITRESIREYFYGKVR